MRRKASDKLAAGIAIGMAAGLTVGAIGAVSMTTTSSSKAMKCARKKIKKGAGKALDTARTVVESIPDILG